VIKCTACGHPFGAAAGDAPGSANDARLAAPAKPAAASTPQPSATNGSPPGSSPSPTTPAATATATVEAPARESASTSFAPGPKRPEPSSVWATPEGTTPPVRTTSPTRTAPNLRSTLPDLAGRRALPTTKNRSNRPDPWLILAAIVVGYAAYAAWNTFELRWVQIALSRTDTEGNVSAVGTATFRASEAMAGTLGHAMIVVLAASALLWLFFGLQRGWNMPWLASPAIALIASVLAIAGTVLSSALWFVWRDAMVGNATRFGISRDELNGILEDVDRSPVVAMQRLAGPGKFGALMALAAVASCAAWWCYRKRTS
jgi:hypothetical protein